MRTMSAGVDTEIPNEEVRSTRLLISYANQDSKPSRETLNAAGLDVLQDYENGSLSDRRTSGSRGFRHG